jgi:hypothetical protein
LNDDYGTNVDIGDLIAYAVRSGSHMYFNYGFVVDFIKTKTIWDTEIDGLIIRCEDSDQKRRLPNPTFVIIKKVNKNEYD